MESLKVEIQLSKEAEYICEYVADKEKRSRNVIKCKILKKNYKWRKSYKFNRLMRSRDEFRLRGWQI